MSSMGTSLIIAIMLVFLVMAVQFESVRYSLMVMMCIPFSLIGSFGLMFLMNEPISMMAMMGILMLVGMVVNNGILLVDGTNELKKEMPLREALIEAGLTRLRPILMTTLTTVLSMLPLLLSGNSGMNMMHGMGVVIVGGLAASTLLAMFLMPPFYLLISDIMMPDIDGYEFAEAIRRSDKNIPILFITARDDFASKKRGFEAGIDDYMVKPLDLDEMLLRIEALLRRAQIAESTVLDIGSVHIDTQARTINVSGEDIPLSAREFNLVHKLLSNPNKTFSRTQLMNEFWDAGAESSTRTVDVYMTRIRSKFAQCTDFEIVTVHGLGYKAVIKI